MQGEAMVMGDLVLLDTEITPVMTKLLDSGLTAVHNHILRASPATANGGVYQFNIPRREPAMDDGMPVSAALGGANGINFQPTGSGKAAITGDFLVTGEEVNPLIRTLRANDIEVTAIHSHMLDDQPRMFFIHFWANDDAQKLAQGVRAALEKTAIATPK
jgi:hypothetical protein